MSSDYLVRSASLRSPSPSDGEGAVTPSGAKVRVGFMCKTTFDHDMEGSGGGKVYPSAEALRRARSCIDECGYVKVEVRLLSIEQDEDFSAYLGSPPEPSDGEAPSSARPNQESATITKEEVKHG